MIEFVAHRVPDEPTLGHLLQRLGYGQLLLPKLADTARREVGRCVIYAPSDVAGERLLVDQESALAFEPDGSEGEPHHSASWNRSFEDTQELMAHLALEQVNAKDGRVLVAEDQGGKRSDPAERRWTQDKLFFGELVYRMLSSASARTQEEALSIVRASAGWLCAIACADVDRATLAPPGGELSDADIMRIAERTAWIGLDAFDGDGLIVWSRE